MGIERPLSILVVDDNRSSADALARLLRKRGDDVRATYDGESAIGLIEELNPDLVLTDLKMEPVDGLVVLKAARSQRPPIETIVFTAYGAVEVAVRAMHLGARDFLTKPVTVEQLSLRIDQIRAGDAPGEPPVPADGTQAHSQAAKDLQSVLERAAGVPTPVWIEGELGAGRSTSARVLHQLGDEARGEDSAFTIRNAAREEAWPSAGAVLLPNVDELPDDLQRELYVQLQEAPPGLRVIATALPGARHKVAEGSLRPELYYHLAVLVVTVPPLRARTEDIVPLYQQGLETFAERYGRAVPPLDEGTRESLLQHSWPGNVRELLNLAERAVVMGENTMFEVIDDAGPGLPRLEPGFSLAGYLEMVERRILAEALRRVGGDRNAAGKLLGLERNTLRYKLKKYGFIE
ncbi:MAG: response regulator [Myxococcota bacterium]